MDAIFALALREAERGDVSSIIAYLRSNAPFTDEHRQQLADSLNKIGKKLPRPKPKEWRREALKYAASAYAYYRQKWLDDHRDRRRKLPGPRSGKSFKNEQRAILDRVMAEVVELSGAHCRIIRAGKHANAIVYRQSINIDDVITDDDPIITDDEILDLGSKTGRVHPNEYRSVFFLDYLPEEPKAKK